ncbi:hypothetical protein SAMN05428987_5008 [Paenibacillus sp. CF095]|uniref:hypothetical protein n=1 Tax=Paenibacillus sp. CF095 TaxID=1881033 RepID=UPI00088EA1F3|nr:hypothetical protein [Paenibacillus sp. CF095]SDD50094.1 hypothetical protein SAMN05428987_5008 [Paenibacillus sp. CF095]
MHGRHMVVNLHDQGQPDLKPGSVLVVPIISATDEVEKALKEGTLDCLIFQSARKSILFWIKTVTLVAGRSCDLFKNGWFST